MKPVATRSVVNELLSALMGGLLPWLVSALIEIIHLLPFRMLALRQAEKEEEKRAREKIRQKLEEDKVLNSCPISLYIF